jgi:transposase
VAVPAHRRAKGGRRPLPQAFPRVEVVHALAAGDCRCSQCQAALTPVSEKVSEQLDIIPATVRVLRHIRKIYACPACEGELKTAPLPAQPIPKSLASPGTLAHIAVAKYVDGLPLYRQERKLARIGVRLPRSTLAHWIVRAGQLVQPLVNLLRERLLAYDIVCMDETRLQVLKEPGRAAESQSYLWVQRGGPPHHPILLYDYDPSRSQRVPLRLLEGFSGALQTDGYEAYGQVCAERGLTAVGCWAHVRRKFDEALRVTSVNPEKRRDALAAAALTRVQALYRIERETRTLPAPERQRIRAARSQSLLADFRAWLDAQLPLVPPQSALGKALHYAHRQWPKLTVYITDGRLRIDNNLTENAIRPFVVGRKNWLFCDTVAGARASANLYSLIETAKANKLEPYAYLRTVFTQLPRAESVEAIEQLLPVPLSDDDLAQVS